MSLPRSVRRHRASIATVTLVAIVVAVYVSYQRAQTDEPALSYTTEQASLGTVSVTVSGTGSLEVDGTSDVYPTVAGKVASVAVSEGSLVTTGTVLYTLDPASAEAATARALASYRQAQQQVAQAEQQRVRASAAVSQAQERSVLATPTATATDVDAAQAELSAAEAALASATASRAIALLDYEDAQAAEDDLSVVAPCSGQVWSLGIAVGDTASPSSGNANDTNTSGITQASTTTEGGATSASVAPVVIAPEQPLAMRLSVNEIDLPALALGQRADIVFDAFPELTATGKIYEIAEQGANNQGVVTFDVWISIDVAHEGLRAGMSAAATVVTDVAANALVISNAAVKTDGESGYYVEVLDAGSDAPRRVAIESGLASATKTQILSGLAEGDTVVTQTIDSTEEDTGSTSGPGGGFMMPGMGGGPPD